MSELAEIEEKEDNHKLKDEEKPEIFSEDENVNRGNMCIGDDDKFTANACLHDKNTSNYLYIIPIKLSTYNNLIFLS